MLGPVAHIEFSLGQWDRHAFLPLHFVFLSILTVCILKINDDDIINSMNENHQLSLDGNLIRIFLTVLEEGSVTAAAGRLELTQSAVSHALKRLNRMVGSPLFVKRGRGIIATAHAATLEPKARALLQGLKSFSAPETFDPNSARWSLTIAANDLQRDLILPVLWRSLEAVAADVKLRVIPSEVPSVELLRAERCDLVLTPHPPAGGDAMQRQLFKDQYVCYYDAACRRAPKSAEDYFAAEHATVVHPNGVPLQFDRMLSRLGVQRRIVVEAPSFAGVSAFLRGTKLIATMPRLLNSHVMRGFHMTPLPLKGEGVRRAQVLSMYLVWHRRAHLDPAHQWLRQRLVEAAQLALKSDGGSR